MQSMSLSAYVYGVNYNTTTPPAPPQPNLSDVFTPDLEGTITNHTHIELKDYVERDVDQLEGGEF